MSGVSDEAREAADEWRRNWKDCRGEHTALVQAFHRAISKARADAWERAAKVAEDEAATDEADGEIWVARRIADRIRALSDQPDSTNEGLAELLREYAFKLGDRVTKTKGSSWTGRIVGTYSTSLTPEGYAVESENEPGSVQIYPVGALVRIDTALSTGRQA